MELAVAMLVIFVLGVLSGWLLRDVVWPSTPPAAVVAAYGRVAVNGPQLAVPPPGFRGHTFRAREFRPGAHAVRLSPLGWIRTAVATAFASMTAEIRPQVQPEPAGRHGTHSETVRPLRRAPVAALPAAPTVPASSGDDLPWSTQNLQLVDPWPVTTPSATESEDRWAENVRRMNRDLHQFHIPATSASAVRP